MIEILNELVNNRPILLAGIWYGVPITIILIVLFFVKSSRDERGRAIIGKASIIATIIFIILVNVVAVISNNMDVNYISMGFCFQWSYDIVLTVEIIAILIYKKTE